MAEEKLGTLQYDMLVNEQKLDKQLEEITKKLQEKDKQWKDILSGQGTVASPKINVADLGNLTKANEAIALSTVNIQTSIKKLKAELTESVKAYEKLTQAKREDDQIGGQLLTKINTQKDQLNEYNKTLRQNIEARKLSLAQAKEEQAAKASLESQRSKAFVKSNLEDEKRITTEIKQQESALRSLEAQRSKAFVRGEVEKEKQITREIKEQQAALKSLEAQRSKAFVASKNKDLREETAQTRRLWQEQKLKIAVDQEAAGSIERLRAQYALLKFQLSQVKVADPNAIANVNRLQSAIAGVKAEITALQPTLGIWGKLVSAIRTYATAYVSVQAVMGLGRAIFNQTKELDALDFSMKTVIKSSTELAGTQKFLSDIAINYGGDLLTLSERYIKFRAAAVQSNVSAAETQKIFESVSKAAGTLGLKTDELSGVYLALEQMLSKGKVTTEELRRQLGERLPGAFGIMANALGVTIPELDKLLKKGEILSTVALPKFAAALEKAYGIESLKKIDTLAAAQGRMSTEFTGLIKSLEASGGFKDAINGIASFIGFVKDNIKTIGFLTKGILIVTAASSAYRIELIILNRVTAASNIIKATYIGWTTKQIVAIDGLTGASLAAAVAQNNAAKATNLWSLAFKGFGGWIGIAVNLLIGFATYLAFFRKETDGAAKAIQTFNENISEQESKVKSLFSSLETAKKGSNEYKDALFEINNQYGKYLPNLLTEKSSIDEVTAARGKSILGLKEELTLKEKRAKLEVEYATQENFNKKLIQDIATIDPNLTEYQKNLILSMIKDMGDAGVNETEVQGSRMNKQLLWFVKQMNVPVDEKTNIFTSLIVKIRNLTDEAIKESARATKAINNIKNTYKVEEPIKPITLDLSELKDAEEEFKKFDALQKMNKERGLTKGDVEFAELAEPNYSERFYSYKNFLITKRKEFLSQSKEDIAAREAIDLKLSELDKKTVKDPSIKLSEGRNEAIKKLNDKYLADQEEFANYEMGIQSTRIANMEDGLEKEIKANELAYANKIKAIEKQKIATLKLINEGAGINIGSKNEIKTLDATGYNKELQDQISNAREADLQKRKNAENDLRESNLRSEKDYQIKINELRRDANDQFLSGIEKERAAINEKYDEWVRKAGTNMTLIAEIEGGRSKALDEMYRQNELDQLDFKREIEYKKNELANKGAINQRKLDKINFETYAKFERERIKILKSSINKDQVEAGVQAETNLLLDERLFKLKQEAELRNQIIDGAKELSGILAAQLGLSQQESAILNGMTDIFTNIMSGNWVGAAVGALGTVMNIFDGNKKEDPTIKALEKINALLETQSRILASMPEGSNYFSLAQKQMSDYTKAIELNTASLRGALTEEEKLRKINLVRPTEPGSPGQPADQLAKAQYKAALEKYNKQFAEFQRNRETLSWTPDQFVEAYANGSLKLDEQQIAWVEGILQAQKARAELLQDTFRTALGFDASNVSDEIMQGIDEGLKLGVDNSLGDFNAAFGNSVKKALVKGITDALQLSLTDGFLQKLTDALSPTSAGGTKITKEEADAAAIDYYNSVKDATDKQNEVNKFLSDYGINIQNASDSSLTKGIQAVTEDTARRLEGLINSVRETGIIQVGKVQQLVESSAAIQGYAAQSLNELRMVNTNLSTQIGIFNDWTTTTNGTGGKGIKVYVQ